MINDFYLLDCWYLNHVTASVYNFILKSIRILLYFSKKKPTKEKNIINFVKLTPITFAIIF
jgi:uncharacterized protein with PQ loop repeat